MITLVKCLMMLGLCSPIIGIINEEEAFRQFEKSRGRVYSNPAERNFRFQIFKKNLALVSEDEDSELGRLKGQILLGATVAKPKTYKKDLNDFADLSDEEFSKYYLLPSSVINQRRRKPGKRLLQTVTPPPGAPNHGLKPKVDWMAFDSPIKNQMRCNSCYTFAANALIEAWTRRETGTVISLSEQEILDCDTVDQDCKGGLPSNAIDYIIKNKIAFSKDYPYEGKKGDKCKVSAPKRRRILQLGFSIDKYNFNGSGRSEWRSPSPSKKYSSQEYSYTVPSSFTSSRKYKHNYNAPTPVYNSWSPTKNQNSWSYSAPSSPIPEIEIEPEPVFNNKRSKPKPAKHIPSTPTKKKPTPVPLPTHVPTPTPVPTHPQTPVPIPTPTHTPTPTPVPTPIPTPIPIPTPTPTPTRTSDPVKNPPSPVKTPPTSPPPKKTPAPAPPKKTDNRYSGIKNYNIIPANILAVLQALEKGPIVVAMHVSNEMKFYSSGTFSGDGCKEDSQPNHAITALGYDLNANPPYIAFKNSWGADWGEKGYFKVAIGQISATSKGICLIGGTEFGVSPVF